MANRSRRWLAIVAIAGLATTSARAADAPAPSREQLLEERLKALEARYEAMDRRHAEAFEGLAKKYEAVRAQVARPPARIRSLARLDPLARPARSRTRGRGRRATTRPRTTPGPGRPAPSGGA